MKNKFCFIVLALIILCFTITTPADSNTSSSLSLCGLKIGESVSNNDNISSLHRIGRGGGGSTLQTVSFPDGEFRIGEIRWTDAGVITTDRRNLATKKTELYRITLYADKGHNFQTESGIKIGSTFREVKEKYGTIYTINRPAASHLVRIYTYSYHLDKNYVIELSFQFEETHNHTDDTRVTSITLSQEPRDRDTWIRVNRAINSLEYR